MPNIAAVLKEEIRRLARKEIKAALRPLRREKVALKRKVRELRRQVLDLARAGQRLAAGLYREQALDVAEPDELPRMRITAKGLRSLRRKLSLTQAEFGKLLGVTGQAVYQWERRQGAIRVRARVRQALVTVRGIGAREARRRLEEMPVRRRRK